MVELNDLMYKIVGLGFVLFVWTYPSIVDEAWALVKPSPYEVEERFIPAKTLLHLFEIYDAISGVKWTIIVFFRL